MSLMRFDALYGNVSGYSAETCYIGYSESLSRLIALCHCLQVALPSSRQFCCRMTERSVGGVGGLYPIARTQCN